MNLVYLKEPSTGRVIGFTLSQLRGYRGESFKESGLVHGATFYFDATSDGRVISVSKEQTAAPGEIDEEKGRAAGAC